MMYWSSSSNGVQLGLDTDSPSHRLYIRRGSHEIFYDVQNLACLTKSRRPPVSCFQDYRHLGQLAEALAKQTEGDKDDLRRQLDSLRRKLVQDCCSECYQRQQNCGKSSTQMVLSFPE